MKKLLIFICLVFSIWVIIELVERKNSKISGELIFTCNGERNVIGIQKGEKMLCYLLDIEYIFTISDVEKDTIIIKTDMDGVSSSSEFDYSEKTWKLKRGDRIPIYTISTNYQDSIVFEWK